jgi:hypothetical protein
MAMIDGEVVGLRPAPETAWAAETIWIRQRNRKLSAFVDNGTLVIQSLSVHYSDLATGRRANVSNEHHSRAI